LYVLSVRLFICQQLCAKSTVQVFVKMLPEICLWTRKKELVKFRPYLDLGLGIYWRILQHCKMGNFLQFGSYLSKYWSELRENFITDVSLEVLVKFRKSFGSEL